MTIRDLDLDSNAHADRILIIGDSFPAAAELGAWLEKRAYTWQHAPDLHDAQARAAVALFDLLVIDLQRSEESPETLLSSLMNDPNLKRSSILIIHPRADEFAEGIGTVFGSNIQALKAPAEAGTFLVKAATLLRLRKLQLEQAGFETKLSQQNAELRDLTNRFRAELKEAKAIQDSLLPSELPTAPQTIFAAYCEALDAVGGDLYDIWRIEDHSYGLFIADVSGHGLPAAIIGAMTKMALNYATKGEASMMFADVNDGISRHMPPGRFITAAGALYDPLTGELAVVRAGHPPALVFHAASKTVQSLEPRGLPFGISTAGSYEALRLRLLPGDKLLLFTDGLTETTDMDGVMWGVEGVSREFARAGATAGIGETIAEILERRSIFSAGRTAKDDVTVIGLERLAS